MAQRDDVAFVWVEEKGKPRPGDVVLKCEDGKRLSVRPVHNCRRCGETGRVRETFNGKTSENLCGCIRDVASCQLKKGTKYQPDYSQVGLHEQAFIVRLEEEVAKLKGERDGLVANALKRADELEALARTKRDEHASADGIIATATETLAVLDANRKPMLAQMEDLRKSLAANADAIDVQQNLIETTKTKAAAAGATIAEHLAQAASLRGGEYGTRAAKLAQAIAKREAAIAEARAKLTPPTLVEEKKGPESTVAG